MHIISRVPGHSWGRLNATTYPSLGRGGEGEGTTYFGRKGFTNIDKASPIPTIGDKSRGSRTGSGGPQVGWPGDDCGLCYMDSQFHITNTNTNTATPIPTAMPTTYQVAIFGPHPHNLASGTHPTCPVTNEK